MIGVTKLGTFTSDPSSQLDVFRHDGNSLGVDGTQICVFEQPHEVSFSGFLEGSNSGALESKIGLEVLCYLPDETLERKLSDQQFG